jgi:hypothetical protein
MHRSRTTQLAMAQMSAGLQGQAIQLDYAKSQNSNDTQLALATIAATLQGQSLLFNCNIAAQTVAAQVHGLDLQYQTRKVTGSNCTAYWQCSGTGVSYGNVGGKAANTFRQVAISNAVTTLQLSISLRITRQVRAIDMTEKQKKLAIIAGTIIIALILLFSSRKAGNYIVNNQDAPPIEVTIPSMNMPVRSPIAINIPGLPSFTPYQYSAISPCMCNGGQHYASSKVIRDH